MTPGTIYRFTYKDGSFADATAVSANDGTIEFVRLDTKERVTADFILKGAESEPWWDGKPPVKRSNERPKPPKPSMGMPNRNPKPG